MNYKINLFRKYYSLIFLGAILVFSSCKDENRGREVDDPVQTNMATDTLATQQVEVRNFTGDITSINTETNAGTEVSGTVNLRVEGSLMRIVVTAEGLAPDMMHMQHLQTAETGSTQCPGQNADANNDGIVDVTEVSNSDRGIHMIPLHMGPSSLEPNVDTYPRTNVNGELQFQRTISLDSLRTAVQEEFGMQDVDFTQFSYVIQGVAQDSKIPQTVQSVSGVEAYASIPVGCAKLEEQ
ncbi:hypothetical protein FHG64_00325 [Antarcticibacterium flavum]|uniref:Uncharacterized protein n=1 Tax=Antarcticibacterium flavum TaxID=2058175 RepID=A0A5B7X025_9FLAO|nr:MULTISPECIES: hypothetical protein [Antarcticibacterium]MCM4160793.1 hypothetical protein [Antarcticibacterium sp. W02-3]QCY67963.1 hypothetical protein FHG64_00325 [Antarcticibacterium flavum]